jgi:hypothetical protein
MSLDVDLGSHAAQWHSWNQLTDGDEAERLDLDDKHGWERLVTLVAAETEETK